jgi:hypothetical protein
MKNGKGSRQSCLAFWFPCTTCQSLGRVQGASRGGRAPQSVDGVTPTDMNWAESVVWVWMQAKEVGGGSRWDFDERSQTTTTNQPSVLPGPVYREPGGWASSFLGEGGMTGENRGKSVTCRQTKDSRRVSTARRLGLGIRRRARSAGEESCEGALWRLVSEKPGSQRGTITCRLETMNVV